MRKARKILPTVGPDEITITEHAYDRAKQRFKLNKSAMTRMALKAWDEKMPSQKWIFKNFGNIIDPNLVVKLYGHYIFIFRDRRLVTVYLSGDKDTRFDGLD